MFLAGCVCERQAASALSPSLHCLYTYGWRHKCTQICRWSHREEANCGNCSFLGCQCKGEGAGFMQVLKQPGNKAFLCLELSKIPAAFTYPGLFCYCKHEKEKQCSFN